MHWVVSMAVAIRCGKLNILAFGYNVSGQPHPDASAPTLRPTISHVLNQVLPVPARLSRALDTRVGRTTTHARTVTSLWGRIILNLGQGVPTGIRTEWVPRTTAEPGLDVTRHFPPQAERLNICFLWCKVGNRFVVEEAARHGS